MSNIFAPIDEFNTSLKEVQIILKRAAKIQNNKQEYDICIKSALLFLVAKFEAFLEDLISDYVHSIEAKGLCPSQIPEVLKLHFADKLIDEKFISDIRTHKTISLQKITMLSRFCVGTDTVDSIEIEVDPIVRTG